MFERIKAKMVTELVSHKAFDILKAIDPSSPFTITEAQIKLTSLLGEEVTPKSVGAHHQYINGEAEDATCAICGSNEVEQAPECCWN